MSICVHEFHVQFYCDGATINKWVSEKQFNSFLGYPVIDVMSSGPSWHRAPSYLGTMLAFWLQPNNLVSQPPPGSQQLNQAQLSALSSQGHSGAPPGMGAHPMHVQQNTPQHMMNHGVNQGNMQHLMRPPMQGPPSGPPPLTPNQQAHKIEDPLNKAKQFFTALLTMSRNQTPTMFPTAQDLLQQLVVRRDHC